MTLGLGILCGLVSSLDTQQLKDVEHLGRISGSLSGTCNGHFYDFMDRNPGQAEAVRGGIQAKCSGASFRRDCCRLT